MATFTEVFERKEVKYRLGACQYQAMLQALVGRMGVDEYGLTRITSTYFDTPERLLIERSLDKPFYKEKLRVRRYGAQEAGGRVFVEIKKKYRGIVYKRRVGCSSAAAQAYLGGVPYEEACTRHPLLDTYMAAESLTPLSVQIAREIDHFILRYETLLPSMLISCDRTAYAPLSVLSAKVAEVTHTPPPTTTAAMAGTGGTTAAMATVPPTTAAEAQSEGDTPDELRITFDASISYRDLFASPVRGMHESGLDRCPKQLLAPGDVVMEIKSIGPYPLWLVRALDACRAYPSSFSKYGEAYRACSQLHSEEVPTSVAHHVMPAASVVQPRQYHAPRHAAKKGGRCA